MHNNSQATGSAAAVAAPERPSCATRARYWVVFFALMVAVITYVDRVSISQAAPFIASEMGLTRIQMGWVFGAFALAYALFEIPGGWLGDWLGPRRVLTRIVLWWSFFTAATGWAWNHTSLVVTRFLFGAGEAGCFPNLAKAFSTWLPPDERVRAQALMWLAARWAGAITPLLVLWTVQAFSWRWAFQIFGAGGAVWAFFFWRWYRDTPRDHPRVNALELQALRGAEQSASGHGDVPWRRLLTSRTVWLLWAQYFAVSYGWSFYITWLPTYLREGRAQTLEGSAWLAVLPLLFGGVGSFTGGFALAALGKFVGGPAAARRWMAAAGCMGAGLLLIVSLRLTDPLWAMVVMGLASFSNDLALAPAWGTCMDVGGKYTGTLSGSMNMAGNLAGFVAPPMVGYLLSWTHQNWAVPFYASAGLYFLGALAWMRLDPLTPLDREPRP